MISALVKSDQVGVWGERAIVPHNPARRCLFHVDEEIKKEGPPCAAIELSFSRSFLF